MAVYILNGTLINTTDGSGACFYDSVTGIAFGPVMRDNFEAQEFLDWLSPEDPRKFADELPEKLMQFRAEQYLPEARVLDEARSRAGGPKE